MRLNNTHGNLRSSYTHREFLRNQSSIETGSVSSCLLNLTTSNPLVMQVNKHMVY